MSNSLQPPVKSAAEFFAGIGLMRIGLERAGWHVDFANDIDEDKWKMYKDHFGDTGEFVLGDVHALKSSELPQVSLATASFPCNDLSLAGSRKGLAGIHSSAFWGFIDAIKGIKIAQRPLMLLVENVPGFLTSNNGEDFKDALLALNSLGYAVDAFIIDAARFVPQSRQRLFVVGIKSKSVSTLEDAPKFFESEARPAALADFILWNPDIDWKIRSLPQLPERSKSLCDIVENLSPNSEMWWNRERCEYLLNQMSPKHRAKADSMIQGADIEYGTVFRRVRNGRSMAELRTDGIAGCLRTPRGGSGRQILVQAGQGKFSVRLLTPRECARLMGVGDFKLNVPLNQALFGFGDAVCVPVIEWIANNYLNVIWQEHLELKRPLRFIPSPVSYAKKTRAK